MESVSNVKLSWKDQTFPEPQSIKYYGEAEIAEFVEKLSNKVAYFKEETDLFRHFTDRTTQGKGFKAKDKDVGLLLKDSLLEQEQTLWLTAEQKADIASHEADELRQELIRIEEKAKKYANKFECKIKECEQFKQVVNSQQKDFRHKILSGGTAGAERLIKWLEESVRNFESMFRSQTLTNAADMSHIRALQQALSKQSELGESLTQVDFMKVEIGNRLLVQAFEKSKNEIQETNRENNNTSLAVADLTEQSMELTKFIQGGQARLLTEAEILKKLDKEREFIDDIRIRLEAWNKKAKEQNMRCPSIAVYIHIEKDIELLEQLRKDFDRKVQIIETASRLKSANVDQKKSMTMSAYLKRKVESKRRPKKVKGTKKEPYEFPAIRRLESLDGLDQFSPTVSKITTAKPVIL
ncbi:hypothetical protein BV898_07001 [Hypsibius exemplaris]|uniref:Uncharacterized protein n=1 Tax=Hypsibius exemplaris TaxID=2072580 RepID=A0A1W0WUR4_HYPEX|nr:hypothetical protein BV898_07001 [Hypsibius exemplaris]